MAKTSARPLVLGGALALCLAVLAFAYWTLSSDPRTLPETDANEVAEGPRATANLEPAAALPPKQDLAAESASTRIALPGEELAAPLPQVEYELFTQDDRPIAGARAALRRDEEVLGIDASNAQGVVDFDASEGRAELIVLAGNAPATTRDVPTTAGRHRIVVERGVAVSGRVRTAARAPVQGVELTLVSDRPLFDDSAWPEAVRTTLELRDRDKLRLRALTDEYGQFEFTGLGVPWSGRLDLGEAHDLIEASAGIWGRGGSTIQLDDPVEGLVLDVTPLPLATGRVVASPGGPGVAGARVQASLNFHPRLAGDEALSASFEGRSREDGSFALPVHLRGGERSFEGSPGASFPRLAHASLTIDGGDDMPRRRLELTGEQLPVGFEFGELVLERGSTLRFAVADSKGAPLAGAVGRLDGERSEPTGENGEGSIVYAPGAGRPLSVSLAGYKEARIDVPGDGVELVPVVLVRTTRLEVSVRDAAGLPAVNANVQVSSPNVGPQRGRGGRGNRTRQESTDEQGLAVFSDLPAEVACAISVRDGMGASVGEQSVTLAPEEWRSLDLTIERTLMSFAGVVRDELGLALAEVSVEFFDVRNSNRSNVSTRTDAAGEFEFDALSNPTGTLRLRKSGFAPVTMPDFAIPPAGSRAELRMGRGLRLTVRIVDERGAPVRGDNLRLELAGERNFQGRRTGENEFDFANLPRVTMVAVANVAGREYRQDIEPLNGNQDFRVPVHGALELELRLEPGTPKLPTRLLLRARDDRRLILAQNVSAELLQTRVFSPVLPGEYQLSISQLVTSGQRNQWETLGATERVTILPAQQIRLELSR